MHRRWRIPPIRRLRVPHAIENIMAHKLDLTAVDNVACQTCHQQRFQSFATDHPDFGCVAV